MPVSNINGSAGPTNTNAYSGWGRVWTTMPVPLGRAMHDGLRVIKIDRMYLHGGSGGSIALIAADDNGSNEANTGFFGSVADGGWNTGWRGLTKWFIGINSGFRVRFGIVHSGTLRYGRHGAGGANIWSNGGLEWGDASLSGQFGYQQAPAAPDIISIEKLSDGRVRVRFNGSGDTGDAAITGWVLQYDDNSSFSSPTTIASSGTSDLSLQAGKTWYFRAAGRNNVTDHVGRYGPWSGVESFFVSGGGKRRTSSGWQSFNTFERLTGPSSSVELSIKRRLAANGWVDLTN
jgi:hypothetical protein